MEQERRACLKIMQDAGVNWNDARQEKSLAQLVVANPNMPLPSKPRRAVPCKK